MSNDLDKIIAELLSLREYTPVILDLPTEEMIRQAEQDIGIPFPEDYKKFLREASNVTYGVTVPLMISGAQAVNEDLLEAVEDARKVGVPKDWLPICQDDGNYFCIVPSGTVRYWDHNGRTDESWPDLATWIKEVWIEEES